MFGFRVQASKWVLRANFMAVEVSGHREGLQGVASGPANRLALRAYSTVLRTSLKNSMIWWKQNDQLRQNARF